MRIWIDVVNSPHVRLFERFLKYSAPEAESLLITTREYGPLVDLVERLLVPAAGGRARLAVVGSREVDRARKLRSHLSRISALAEEVSKFSPDVAVSKASPELARISLGLGIPSVIANDNDQSVFVSRLTFPLADSIVVPLSFPDRAVIDGGGSLRRTRKFRGTFEVAHILQHAERGPYERVDLGALGVEPGEYVIFRPEPFGASYLTAESRAVGLVREIARRYDVVVIPRGPEDEALWRREGLKVPPGPLDFLDLASKAAAVVGAGGTMTREAALLGVPSASAYPGREPCVSAELEGLGMIYRLRDPTQVLDFLSKAEDREAWRARAEAYLADAEDPAEVLWEEVTRVSSARSASS